MQSVEHLCNILHDFTRHCARAVPLHQQSFLLRINAECTAKRINALYFMFYITFYALFVMAIMCYFIASSMYFFLL